MASELSSAPYTFGPTYAGVIGHLDDPTTTTSFCIYQILHLGLDGKPFWFNGGIRLNKQNEGSRAFGNFTHWMPGIASAHEGAIPAWDPGAPTAETLPCLAIDREQVHTFSENEQTLVQDMLKEAAAVDDIFLGLEAL